jgi:hypothetical protein
VYSEGGKAQRYCSDLWWKVRKGYFRADLVSLMNMALCSAAGLLSARICADHFEDVVLIDPELSKSVAGHPKTRIMQYQSLHSWYLIVVETLDRLWPGFSERLEKLGAL